MAGLETPRFHIQQNTNQIIITILAPYANAKKTEIHVLEDDFRFHCKPYYLRLTLPGNVLETETSSAQFVQDTSTFIITLDKMSPGDEFPDLDMLTTMLQPKGLTAASSKPLIEVLSGETEYSGTVEGDEWHIEQTLVQEDSPAEKLRRQYNYGFANKHNGLMDKFNGLLDEMIQISNPDTMSFEERKEKQALYESLTFSDEHYLADLLDTDLSSILAFKLDLKRFAKLTDAENEQMMKLANREFLLTKTEEKTAYLGLLDILCAYLMDLRTTEGGHCVESAWNIARVSATISWFQTFNNPAQVVRSFGRRALTYPLFRHFDLLKATLRDAVDILLAGKVAVLKCFLDIYKIFKNRDPFYLLNQLYIEEYCVWIQKISSTTLNSLATALSEVIPELSKASLDLDLPELEAAAEAVQDEEMEQEITNDISGLAL